MQETDGQLGTDSADTVDEAESSKGSQTGGTRYFWAQSGVLGGVSPTKPSISLRNPEIYSQRRGGTVVLQNRCRRSAAVDQHLLNIETPSFVQTTNCPLPMGNLRPVQQEKSKYILE